MTRLIAMILAAIIVSVPSLGCGGGDGGQTGKPIQPTPASVPSPTN